MTDTRNRAGRAADEATLDLFEPGALPAAGKKADTQVATKAKKSQSKGKRAIFGVLTAALWSFYLYLLLPLASLLAWWLGFTAVYEEMVMRRGLMPNRSGSARARADAIVAA